MPGAQCQVRVSSSSPTKTNRISEPGETITKKQPEQLVFGSRVLGEAGPQTCRVPTGSARLGHGFLWGFGPFRVSASRASTKTASNYTISSILTNLSTMWGSPPHKRGINVYFNSRSILRVSGKSFKSGGDSRLGVGNQMERGCRSVRCKRSLSGCSRGKSPDFRGRVCFLRNNLMRDPSHQIRHYCFPRSSPTSGGAEIESQPQT